MILARMEELEITRAELSRRIGATEAAITILFSEETASSRLVPAIHDALDLPPPPPPESIGDEEDALKSEILRGWPKLSDEERMFIAQFVRMRKQR